MHHRFAVVVAQPDGVNPLCAARTSLGTRRTRDRSFRRHCLFWTAVMHHRFAVAVAQPEGVNPLYAARTSLGTRRTRDRSFRRH